MSESFESNLNCKAAREQFALLLYGELSFDEEERIESHLDTCAECRGALERQKALHEAVDAAAVTPSPALLNRGREDLGELLLREKPRSGWAQWGVQMSSGWKIQLRRPVGAMAPLPGGCF